MNQSNFTIYLASRSPRRIELLKQLGLDCQVLPSDIDESTLFSEHPAAYVQRLAQQKAEACFKTLMQQKLAVLPISEKNLTVFSGHILNSNDLVKPKQLVIAADTTVAINREILGKPIDDHDARAMLRLLSGSQHQVHTACCNRYYRKTTGHA